MKAKNQKIKLIYSFMLVVTLINLGATLYSRGQQKMNSDTILKSEDFEKQKNRFPIADYESLKTTDPEKRAKREARNKRHNKSMLGVKGGMSAPQNSGDRIVLNTDWEVNTPPLPVAQSDVVLLGEIVDASAHVSEDKNGVYSEFTVRVEDVMKSDNASSLLSGKLVSIERQGGQVRYPSGRVEWFSISLQNMPLPNRRYVLFLKRVDAESLTIITGYELHNGVVSGLDNEASQFSKYDGTDEASFLQTVRAAVAAK